MTIGYTFCDSAIGWYDYVIVDWYAFQYSVSATYPHMIPYVYGAWLSNDVSVDICDRVKVCVHYQNIPWQEAIVTKSDFFLADDGWTPRDGEIFS